MNYFKTFFLFFLILLNNCAKNSLYNNDLKNKIRSFREEFGEDSAPYNLTALRMRKMNEVRRLLWPAIDQKQEYSGEEQVVKVEDVEKLIISERLKKSNAPSMWLKILELYGIKKSRNAKGFDEHKSIVEIGLPFKIENTSNGLILVWPAVGNDFAFFSQLGEKDTHKLAEKLDILIKRALAG
jgi:hypothetical protein